ncbi:hypothetical protein Baya_16537 [Bagarius yarrelli]|uniref:Uncharacterized protein n=1 Tax=Bagarius yarrelli TaxID=175774 RepID=A0A556VWE2_BAGYA|nr:hypothetical protein Baya_16537 [Bagarius yarrelli]
MICLWWIIFKTLFVLVGGGALSGSAEAAGGLKGGAGQNTGAMNSMVLPQLLLIQNVPAPIGANKNQGAGLPVVFPVVQQQQQAGPPNLQAQANPPMIPILAFLPAEANGVNRQVQLLPIITQNVQQGAAAAAGNTRVKVQNG